MSTPYIIHGKTGDWELVIGLEVHAQVTSNSKLFSGAPVEFGSETNQNVSFVDAGMPGMLPVIVNEYMGNFLEESPIPGIEFQFEFVQGQLDGITIAEINALANKYLIADNRTVLVLASEKDKAKLPTEATILEWINTAGKDVTAYEDKVVNKPLIENLPAAGRTVSTMQIPEIGVTELTLSNGVKVVLKPTDFKNDEILIGARSQGGTSLYDEKDYMSAGMADAVVEESGIGEFN